MQHVKHIEYGKGIKRKRLEWTGHMWRNPDNACLQEGQRGHCPYREFLFHNYC
jgi:hypothetical protein